MAGQVWVSPSAPFAAEGSADTLAVYLTGRLANRACRPVFLCLEVLLSLFSGLEGWIGLLFFRLGLNSGRFPPSPGWAPGQGLVPSAIIRICVRGSWMLTSRFGGLAATSLRSCLTLAG